MALEAAPFSHELTDWHNLLQGSIGAIIAVIGAYVAARKTIRGQLDAQRTIELEREWRPKLVKAMQALQPVMQQVEYLQTVVHDAEDWEALSEPLGKAMGQVDAILVDDSVPLPVYAESIYMQVSLTGTVALRMLRDPRRQLDRLDVILYRLKDRARTARWEFANYLRDPAKQNRSWRRAELRYRLTPMGAKEALARSVMRVRYLLSR